MNNDKIQQSSFGPAEAEAPGVAKEREQALQGRAFRMMLEIAVIFAVPAFGALALGRYLDRVFGAEQFWLFICLGAAFILSWAVVIIRYLKLDKQIRDNQEQLAHNRKQINQS